MALIGIDLYWSSLESLNSNSIGIVRHRSAFSMEWGSPVVQISRHESIESVHGFSFWRNGNSHILHSKTMCKSTILTISTRVSKVELFLVTNMPAFVTGSLPNTIQISWYQQYCIRDIKQPPCSNWDNSINKILTSL